MNLTPTPSQARRAARDRRIIADYHDLRKAHPTAAVMQIVRTIAASGKYNLKPEGVKRVLLASKTVVPTRPRKS